MICSLQFQSETQRLRGQLAKKGNMQISLVLIVAAAATCVTGQHLLLAGGGLTKDSDFFWNRLIQLAVN